MNEEQAPRKTAEAWAKELHTEPHWFAAARYAGRWGVGKELTEDEFRQMVEHVQNILLR